MPHSSQQYIWKCIFSTIIWLLLGFTIVPFFLIVFAVRFITAKVISLVDKSISEPLPVTSSIFAPLEEENKSHVVFCFGLEGTIELDDLASTFESHVVQKKNSTGGHQWPELQQYIVHKLGFQFWHWDKSFNIRKHIRILEIDPNFEESALNPQDVLDIIEEKVIHTPFPPEQSPWEILLVPKFNDTPKYGSGNKDGQLGTLFMFHFDHAFGDGTAVAAVFEELFNGGKKHRSVLRSNAVSSSSFANTLNKYFFGPYDLLTFGNVSSKFYWSPNTKKMKYNAAVSPIIPVETIKHIRKSSNVSFSAVLSLLIGNALYKFMREAGYEVPETVSYTLPRVVDGHPRTKLRNHFTVASLPLPMRKKSKQLREIQGSLDESTASSLPDIGFIIIKLMGGLGTLLPKRMMSSVAIEGDMACSNINLFPDEQRFKDTNILSSVFYRGSTKTGGNGIAVFSTGCNGGFRILFQIDKGIVPTHRLHAKIFIKYFLQEMENLILFNNHF